MRAPQEAPEAALSLLSRELRLPDICIWPRGGDENIRLCGTRLQADSRQHDAASLAMLQACIALTTCCGDPGTEVLLATLAAGQGKGVLLITAPPPTRQHPAS